MRRAIKNLCGHMFGKANPHEREENINYLILAILSSTAISLLIPLSNSYVKNNMVMFAANDTVCALLSLLFLRMDGGTPAEPLPAGLLRFAVSLGLVSGVL